MSEERRSAAAIAQYQKHARDYDRSARFTRDIRARTIARLRLEPGQSVLDTGSGTGLSLEAIVAAIGPAGRVVAIEQSPDMMALARERVAREGWRQVELVEAPIEAVALSGSFDAVLFHYVHDILQSRPALDAIFSQTRSGAAVAVAGVKYHPWWLAPLNLHVRYTMQRYSANPTNLAQPWSVLEPFLSRFERESTLWGRGYIGWGNAR